MDSRIGLDYIVENCEYVEKLAKALDTNNETVKKQVFELLSALCAYSRSGYRRAIETFETFKVKIIRSRSISLYLFLIFCRILKMKDTGSKSLSRSWTKQRQAITKWRYWHSSIV